MESNSALPEYIEHSLLIELIEQGDWLLVDDPFKDLALVVEEPTSKNAIKRDENFQLIQPIVTHAEFHGDIFVKENIRFMFPDVVSI